MYISYFLKSFIYAISNVSNFSKLFRSRCDSRNYYNAWSNAYPLIYTWTSYGSKISKNISSRNSFSYKSSSSSKITKCKNKRQKSKIRWFKCDWGDRAKNAEAFREAWSEKFSGYFKSRCRWTWKNSLRGRSRNQRNFSSYLARSGSTRNERKMDWTRRISIYSQWEKKKSCKIKRPKRSFYFITSLAGFPR